jgi:hypothetical protein
MKNDIDDRIKVLEARVAALEALAPKKPAPRPPVDEGVRITYPTASPTTSLPTDAQLAELRKIVLRHRPKLAPNARGKFADQDQTEFERGFEGAFRWLATAGRADEINYRHYIAHWIDAAERYLASLGTPETIRGNALMAAPCWLGGMSVTSKATASATSPRSASRPTAASRRPRPRGNGS